MRGKYEKEKYEYRRKGYFMLHSLMEPSNAHSNKMFHNGYTTPVPEKLLHVTRRYKQ